MVTLVEEKAKAEEAQAIVKNAILTLDSKFNSILINCLIHLYPIYLTSADFKLEQAEIKGI